MLLLLSKQIVNRLKFSSTFFFVACCKTEDKSMEVGKKTQTHTKLYHLDKNRRTDVCIWTYSSYNCFCTEKIERERYKSTPIQSDNWVQKSIRRQSKRNESENNNCSKDKMSLVQKNFAITMQLFIFSFF